MPRRITIKREPVDRPSFRRKQRQATKGLRGLALRGKKEGQLRGRLAEERRRERGAHPEGFWAGMGRSGG